MTSSKHDPVVVIGLGRFGSSLALALANRGVTVLAIDNRPKVVQALAGRLERVVIADSTDIEALRQLGVQNYSRAVVAIGTYMEASILTVSMLAELEIPEIWAKAINRRHGRILERIGAHHVILPEHDMGERIARLVSSQMLDYIEVDEDFGMIKIKPPREIVGIPLGQCRLRSRYGVTVVAVKPQAVLPGQERRFAHATPDTVLTYGDLILVVGSLDKLEKFANLP